MNTQQIEQFLSTEFDGFTVELNLEHERGDIILGRPPFNVIAKIGRASCRERV